MVRNSSFSSAIFEGRPTVSASANVLVGQYHWITRSLRAAHSTRASCGRAANMQPRHHDAMRMTKMMMMTSSCKSAKSHRGVDMARRYQLGSTDERSFAGVHPYFGPFFEAQHLYSTSTVVLAI
jgi:hypothetical protein